MAILNPKIPAQNQGHAILPPLYTRSPFVDPTTGHLLVNSLQFLQQLYVAVLGQNIVTETTLTTNTFQASWAGGITNNQVTLTEDATITNSGAINGQYVILTIIQGTTGSHLVTWGPEFDFGLAGVPTLSVTAGKRDHLSMIYNQPANKYDVLLVSKGY
jgi:hypothetical protein